MRIAKRPEPTRTESLDLLMQAVVSIYLYMARSARLSGSEINVIDRMLRYLFGNEIPLYQIEHARLHTLPLREAANLLNRHLSHADKLKLILNLTALAYRDPNKLHILGNVEIVELTDLLRVDVNILDAFYDVAEGLAASLALPVSSFLGSRHHILKGSMLWGAESADFPLTITSGEPLIFVMIENLVLVCHTASGQSLQSGCWLENRSDGSRTELTSGLFYHFKASQQLVIRDDAKSLEIDLEDVWSIYRLPASGCQIPLRSENGDTRKLCWEAGRLWLAPLKASSSSRNQKELALNDSLPGFQTSEPVLRLITRRGTALRQIATASELFVQRLDGRHRLIHSRDGDCPLRLVRETEQWWLEALSSDPVFVNRTIVTQRVAFAFNNDVLTLDNLSYLINRDLDLIEIPIEIRELRINDVYHEFSRDKTVALDGISFTLNQGSMMAIMGPSGSGKTTLLKVLLGELEPQRASIEIDQMDFRKNYGFFRKFIGYVPQDDLLFANLSVYENVYFNLRLRLPQIKDPAQIKARIDNLLRRVGLFEQRDMIVGDVMNKRLSGGQRRRLNIALELVSNPMIIILDEPTSGLSSKDSENIAGFLAELKEQGKIILCTIHQPNATILKQFDRVLLMDVGGTQVFNGDTESVFTYFDDELASSGTESQKLAEKKRLRMPEYFYDLIELRENDHERRFQAQHWKQKWRDHRFRQALDLRSGNEAILEDSRLGVAKESRGSGLSNLALLLRRAFINKSRSRLNLIMTLGVAPLLALLTSLILRSATGTEVYSFRENQNFPLFCFIQVIIFVFIGLANSVDDVLGEKRVILREKNLNIRVLPMIASKNVVLFAMTLVQSLLFYQISAWVLGIRGSFWPLLLSLQLSGMLGYKMGLLSSSLINDRAAIINILPLILIPQIMFSGAVIRFQDMNSALRIDKKREVPEFCQVIPSRWLFETSLLAQDKLNSRSRAFTHYKKLLSDMRDPGYLDYVQAFDDCLLKRPESSHSNRVAQSLIREAHGRHLEEGRNVFLSHTSQCGSKSLATLWIDLAVLMVMIMFLDLVLWLKLRFWYR
ncbi:MAG TPA: ATP-binding cassette domain-containing protein [Candidatus Cloacimonadota bacterium]|nr:ATP-binding cassette domain-containing protein [Candidatus Cloacimonadota bacterium]